MIGRMSDPPGSPPRIDSNFITFLYPEANQLFTENVELKREVAELRAAAARARITEGLLMRMVLGNAPPPWLVSMVEQQRVAALQEDRAFAILHGVAWTPGRRWFHHADPAPEADPVAYEVATELLRRMREAAIIIVMWQPSGDESLIRGYEKNLTHARATIMWQMRVPPPEADEPPPDTRRSSKP